MDQQNITRAKPSSHDEDFDRLEARALELIRQNPGLAERDLVTWLAREARQTREDVTGAVCAAYSTWSRLGASRAHRLRARSAA
jgi:hypothetical protein